MQDGVRTIAAFAASQHGVFTRADWLAFGLSARRLQLREEAGVIERVGVRTFRFLGQPNSWEQELTVGLLDLGDAAVVAGDAAGRLLGLDGFERVRAVAFCVPRTQRGRTTIAPVRSIGNIRSIDRVRVDGFACMSASRLVIEEAGRWDTSRLVNAVSSSIRLGWTSEAFLRVQLSRLRSRGKAGVRALDAVLDGPLGESWLEHEILRLIALAGLRTPETQRVIRGSGRTIARVDLLWPADLLVVEVNGHRHHSLRSQLQRDEQRRTELTLLGYRVLTFTYDDVVGDDVVGRPGWVLARLREALTKRVA